MNNLSRRQIFIAFLCFCLAASVPVSAARLSVQAPPSPPKEEFQFTKVDLELLEQVNLLDKRFDRDGLVYADEPTNAYLQRVGESLVARDLKLENVVWQFRVLSDPVPNAFALPNGSIYVNTGLLALLENEAQLASVLAHEETHVLHRHSYLENRSARK